MKRNPSPTDEHVIYALREALDAVVVPHLRDQILVNALRRAGERNIPEGDRLSTFLGGPLRATLGEVVGPDAADHCLETVAHVLRPVGVRVGSGVRWRTMDVDPFARVVHLVTGEPLFAEQMVERLGQRSSVYVFEDLHELLRALDRSHGNSCLLVVDLRSHTMTEGEAAELERRTPAGTRVLLVGALPGSILLRGRPPTWITVAAEATAEEVGWLCEMPIRPATDLSRPPSAPPPSVDDATGDEILLVDDDEAFCRAVSRRLRHAGYDVVTASNAREAMQHCAKSRPALILTDLWMPGMSGLQMSNAIQLVLGQAAPPIVLVTGGDTSAADMTPVARLLEKPISAEDLLSVVRELKRPRAASR